MSDLDFYLAHAADAPDAEAISGRLEALRRQGL
jgi:regulator of sirC expression with transglutaminase-like and TPR domain